ncbi:MAG TPA: hypothetical protein VJ692_01080 [Nitrospiraceae bacterium]|nr:hypothetical protein [Nitrospiraceae bacterium]
MKRAVIQWAVVLGLGGMSSGFSGCIASAGPEQAIRDAEFRLQQEERLTQELATANKSLRFRIAEQESTLRSLRDQLMRTDKEWRDARDELLRIKMDKEQHALGRERFSYLDRPDLESRPTPEERAEERAEGALKKAKELLRQLQILLDQYSGKEPL